MKEIPILNVTFLMIFLQNNIFCCYKNILKLVIQEMNNLIFPPLLPIRVAIKRSIIKQQTHFFSQKLFSISPNGSEKCLCDVDKK